MQYQFSFEEEKFRQLLSEAKSAQPNEEELRAIFSCIDNTTLNGNDTETSVAAFCDKTLRIYEERGFSPASVCVYPTFVGLAKRILKQSPIRVASVAGGFPSGQTFKDIKANEIKEALDQGADEIDFVINRGSFLDGNHSMLCDEVKVAKELCGEKTLKVILETGELQTAQNIFTASMLTLQSGADFIKTSTGKITTGATPEAAFVMLSAINEFRKKNKKIVGFKAAGGLSDIKDALVYYRMTKKLMDKEEIVKQNFRIGTSRLTADILKNLT